MEGLRSFIVHGHDDNAKLALKNYLQNTLRWPEPVILAEKPSGGKTIIEKFEDHAKDIDVVFVLMTPDDMGGAVGSPSAARARQNVILELGHFTGKLGRTSGRVILLQKGDLELPSDLAGIVYIDISDGVEAAGEKIRKAVATLARIN
jgi:predicted nucleotide-binding protein